MAYLPLRTGRAPRGRPSGRLRRLAGRSWRSQLGAPARTGTGSPATCCSSSGTPASRDYDTLVDDPATPAATRAALLALDPHNVTLEPEYYADVDPERYARLKPLHWLWQSFDRTPLGAGNVHLGVRFRRILAPHLFAPLRAEFQVLSLRGVFLRLQPGSGRRLRGAPPRAARRPRRHHAREPGEHLRLRQHLQPHPQHRGPEGRDQRADRARGRRADHLPRDRARRRAGRAERDGGRRGRGHEERPPLPRERRHSGQVDPGEAQRARRRRT